MQTVVYKLHNTAGHHIHIPIWYLCLPKCWLNMYLSHWSNCCSLINLTQATWAKYSTPWFIAERLIIKMSHNNPKEHIRAHFNGSAWVKMRNKSESWSFLYGVSPTSARWWWCSAALVSCSQAHTAFESAWMGKTIWSHWWLTLFWQICEAMMASSLTSLLSFLLTKSSIQHIEVAASHFHQWLSAVEIKHHLSAADKGC